MISSDLGKNHNKFPGSKLWKECDGKMSIDVSVNNINRLIADYVREHGIIASEVHSVYDRTDHNAYYHLRGGCDLNTFPPCELVFPNKVSVEEETENMFNGQYSVPITVTIMQGIDNPITCKCGKLNNVTLRVDSSFTKILADIFNFHNIEDFTINL